MKWRGILLAVVTVAIVAAAFFFARIPQNQTYHDSADQRTILGVPNGLNVISNVLFLLVGVLGISHILRRKPEDQHDFVDSRERWPWLVFFVAVALTAFGSAYYHINPNNHTLVWDRLPMAVGFMGLLAAAFAERVSVTAGLWLLLPLAICSAASVLWWSISESEGNGDLRPYALVQFGSVVILVLILALYPPRYTRGADFIVSLAIYAVAKVFEWADRPIYALSHVVSGHTLKHIAAAISAWWILRMLQLRTPVQTLP